MTFKSPLFQGGFSALSVRVIKFPLREKSIESKQSKSEKKGTSSPENPKSGTQALKPQKGWKTLDLRRLTRFDVEGVMLFVCCLPLTSTAAKCFRSSLENPSFERRFWSELGTALGRFGCNSPKFGPTGSQSWSRWNSSTWPLLPNHSSIPWSQLEKMEFWNHRCLRARETRWHHFICYQ